MEVCNVLLISDVHSFEKHPHASKSSVEGVRAASADGTLETSTVGEVWTHVLCSEPV